MKPLGVLVLVILAVGGLFTAIYLLGDDDETRTDGIESISQSGTDTTPSNTGSGGELTPATTAERTTVTPVVESERVDVAPENSEQFANQVSVLVLTPDEKPVGDATVVLTQAGIQGMIFQNEPLDRSKDRQAKTDKDGRAKFLNVEPFHQYTAEGVASGYSRASSNGFAVHATGDTEVTVVLSIGASLAGQITDTGGQPVGGATVTLDGLFSQFDGGTSPDTLTTTTEADGSYMLANVLPGNRRLNVSADGYANQTKGGLVFRGEEPLEMNVTLEIAEMICGKVISKAGSPVAGAKVLGINFSNSNRQCRDQAISDENGDFCLEHLAAGKYNIAVSAEGYRRSNEPRVQTGGAGLIVELEDQGVVNGRVIVAEGTLPKPYTVQLRQTHQGNKVTTLIGESKRFNQEDGAFSIECTMTGTYIVQAVAPGYAPSFSDEFQFTMGNAMNGVTVRLTQGGSISGRVVDSEGNAVARPRITTHDNDWTNSLFDKALGDQFPTNTTKSSVTGNMNGQFKVDLLKSETYQISIRAAGYCEYTMRDVRVNEGSDTNVGDIALIKGGEVTGTVIDAAGQPVVGAMVRMNVNENSREMPRNYETKSGPGGKYVIANIYPGKYKLTASKSSDPLDFLGAISDELDQVQLVTITDGQSQRYELKVGQ